MSHFGTERVFLRAHGIVQGVGFRPFVARLAAELCLAGHVENTTRGVEIVVQGPPSDIRRFRERLVGSLPPMASVLKLETETLPPDPDLHSFSIRASRIDPVASAIIPPDIATCGLCLSELLDPRDRRFGYPFINCTDCGPRYTLIRSIPYDRERTSMDRFRLCPNCASEYEDPASRRFHAQPNACAVCGPRLQSRGSGGELLSGDPVRLAIDRIARGEIVALLGVGGFHLACDAGREDSVAELRRRKNRPAKPFAVMTRDLATARELAVLDEEAERLLAGPRAPILLVAGRGSREIAPSVAPGQHRIGLFLPYTPLHHLLLRGGGFRALVMTSGNRSDEPLLATWEEAWAKLERVADFFVVHDRPVLHRVDDSVVKPMGLGPVVIRRARGYAPAPVPLWNPEGKTVLAVGAELASAVAVVRGEYAYLGPHVGDLKNLDVEEAFRAGIDHLLELLRVKPDQVVCDLHPEYRSTRYAGEWESRGVPVARVQHHEAHAAACMAEAGFSGDGIALALDGLGYGRDGTLWGGEILAGSPGRFERKAHLVQVPQPGGDRAAREPWRMAASHLRRIRGERWLATPLAAFRDQNKRNLEVLEAMIVRGVNVPLTSSCGRLFDAAAAILGFSGPLLYSAQAAMELEALAEQSPEPAGAYAGPAILSEAGRLILDPGPIIEDLTEDVLRGRDHRVAALSFHAALARLLAAGVREVASMTGFRHVFLTGGCAQNAVLVRAIVAELCDGGLVTHSHRQVPPNDGGISFGQAAWFLRAESRS